MFLFLFREISLFELGDGNLYFTKGHNPLIFLDYDLVFKHMFC